MVMRLSSAAVPSNTKSGIASRSRRSHSKFSSSSNIDEDDDDAVVSPSAFSVAATSKSSSSSAYLKDKKTPPIGLLTWRSIKFRATSKHLTTTQRRVQWLICSVCAFVTLQFVWTVILFVTISQKQQLHQRDGRQAPPTSPHHLFPTGTAASAAKENPLSHFLPSLSSTLDMYNNNNHKHYGYHKNPNAMEIFIHATEESLNSLFSLRGSHDMMFGDDTDNMYSIVFSSAAAAAVIDGNGNGDDRNDSWLDRNVLAPIPRPAGGARYFGGLDLSALLGKEYEGDRFFRRRILEDNYNNNNENSRRRHKEEEEEESSSSASMEEYYAFDDDAVRAETTAFNEKNEEDYEHYGNCRRTAIHRMSFPTCNRFHELGYVANPVQSNFKFLNNGAFRQVFAYQHYLPKSTLEKVVMKEIVYEDIDTEEDPMYGSLEYVRMDAIVAERLTASPRIYDIYGYCGVSILSEFFPHGDLEEMSAGPAAHVRPKDLNDSEDVDPHNNLTPRQKLFLALDMAEALADLHGHADALIIHNDVQLSQFLLNADKTRLKLNDFNRAEFALWDEEHGQYCRYQNGKGPGNWRSPEEYKDLPLTEAIDVWSYGNNLYALLTGLDPFYQLDNRTGKPLYPTKDSVALGLVAYIDPRYEKHSEEEKVLVQVTKKCFRYLPEARPTIFEIVAELRQAIEDIAAKDNERQQQQPTDTMGDIHTAIAQSRQSVLQALPPPEFQERKKKKNKKRKKKN